MKPNLKKKPKKINKFPKNPDSIPLTFSYPVGTTTYSKTFEYNTNLTLNSSDNIASYEVYINNLYYGNNISQFLTGKIQLNSNDTLRIEIVKDNGSLESNFEFTSILL